MKFYSRLQVYKASNLTFNPATGEGRSYDWYSIARRFDGVQVLNTYRYSVTTGKHIRKLENLFSDLRLECLFIEAPRGLQDLDAAIEFYRDKIATLETEIKKPRTNKAKNEERKEQIKHFQAMIKTIKALQ